MTNERICGALGCTNDADGTVEHNHVEVWSCRECADKHGKELIEDE
jgi:Zn-finger protein